jgi:hypothetical protein
MKAILINFLILTSINTTILSQVIIPKIFYGAGDTIILYIHPFDNAIDIEWGAYGIDITCGNGAENMAYGLPNTNAIVEQLGDNGGVPYAAKVCDTLTAFGYSDWYLPSHGEIITIAYKLDSIPLEYRPSGYFWSSYEVDTINAYRMFMFTGYYEGAGDLKYQQYQCRCIRREYITQVSNPDYGSSGIDIYMSESNGVLNVSVSGVKGECELALYNMQGNKLFHGYIKIAGSNYNGNINVSGYPKGTYILEVKNEDLVKRKKLML